MWTHVEVLVWRLGWRSLVRYPGTHVHVGDSNPVDVSRSACQTILDPLQEDSIKAPRQSFDAQRGPAGALLIGEPDEVAEKIVRHSEAPGGISRITFQMNASSLPHAKRMRAIDMIGARVAPALRQGLADD